jgi:hypothetical protein
MNTLGQEYQNLNTNVVKQNSNIRLSFDFKFVLRDPSQEDRIPT